MDHSPAAREDRPHEQTIKIDIWSDVQCGWCFIGKRRLEAAIEGFDGEVEIEYHSFELAPGAPAEFDGATEEFLHHYRGAPFTETERMLAKVTAIAAAEGLDFHFDRTHPTNTILAHELIHLAKSKGRQSEMNERLSDAYFQRGEHIGRIPDLVEIGVELGFVEGQVAVGLVVSRRECPPAVPRCGAAPRVFTGRSHRRRTTTRRQERSNGPEGGTRSSPIRCPPRTRRRP